MAMVFLEPQDMVLSSYVSTKKLRGGLSHSFALRLTPLLLWLGPEEEAG